MCLRRPWRRTRKIPDHSEQTFGTHLLETAIAQPQSGSTGKNKVVLIGAIAAGILVMAAGGITWYARQSSTPAVTSTAPVQQAPAVVAAVTPPQS